MPILAPGAAFVAAKVDSAVVTMTWAEWVQLAENSKRAIVVAPGAFKPEPVANAKFQHMRNSTTIGAYKERWTHGSSKSKNAWYDDLGNEIKFGLFMFRDPIDFVFPAATTVFKQRRRDGVGQAIPVKRLPPTVPIATNTTGSAACHPRPHGNDSGSGVDRTRA